MADSRDVVDLIEKDHREIERLFELLRTDPGQRDLAVTEVMALLVAHSRAEEAEVYPVARDEAGETEEVAHSQEEHAEAEAFLTARAEHLGERPGEATRADLAQQARNLGVDGTGSMSKEELREEVRPD
ncbi:hypothetical protein E1262_07930 [Jiangella aurantiaca]|uniref:Hemerythrin-like domain-containing protein n=1 Tax=Jiangella aurantiaca TaxID=2530373 RepID=A0A4R5AES4_9ACTN|nr:hemerythrin domain-containing protein [Jiangella aurantiaca]TDD71043.1 hypothetical protein E1262_07930 [Jiangella aurantiaca]